MPIQDLTPQLRTRLRKVEWITGLFLGVTALLMLGGFVYFLKQTAEARGWFITYVPYYTYLNDATGVKEGTPVKMLGFTVGEVTEVTAIRLEERQTWDYYQTNNFNVFVAFKVTPKYAGYIFTDYRVRISGFPVELAGGSFLELQPGGKSTVPTAKMVNDKAEGVLWEKYAYTPSSNLLQYGALTNKQKGYYLAVDQSETLLAQAQRILKNADDITAFLRTDLPRVTQDALQTLSFTRQTIGALTNDVVLTLQTARLAVASLTNDLGGLIANSRRITGQVADVLPGLTNDLANTLATSRRLMDSVNEQLPAIAGNVNLTLTNLNVLLLRDTNITANTSLLVSNVNNLITKHWLFRSAFKAQSGAKPTDPSESTGEERDALRSLTPGFRRGAGLN